MASNSRLLRSFRRSECYDMGAESRSAQNFREEARAKPEGERAAEFPPARGEFPLPRLGGERVRVRGELGGRELKMNAI